VHGLPEKYADRLAMVGAVAGAGAGGGAGGGAGAGSGCGAGAGAITVDGTVGLFVMLPQAVTSKPDMSAILDNLPNAIHL